mgnify:CR=1 FL=1
MSERLEVGSLAVNGAQIDLLAGLGCDLIQGFVVSAPLDAEATERWLRR